MVEDADEPTVILTVHNGDAEAMKAALIAEGIEVSELSDEPVAGLFFVPFLAAALFSGVAYDVEKFIVKRGAEGVKKLVKNVQKESGKPDAKGTVLLQDEKKTTVVLPSDLPAAAYEALEKLDLKQVAGLTLHWNDPPGKWQIDVPPKITPAGDDSF